MPAQSLSRRVPDAIHPVRRAVTLWLLAALIPILGCDNPQEPAREPTTAPPSLAISNDSLTLLLLRFNGNTAGVDGERPVEASGLTYEPGVFGSGVLVDGSDRLRYAGTGNFTPTAGTVEFWIKPRWNGSDGLSRTLLATGQEGCQLVQIVNYAGRLTFSYEKIIS